MSSNLKCSIHANKIESYICTHSQCVDNKICGNCVLTHPNNDAGEYYF